MNNTLQWLQDRAEIQDVILRFALAIDEMDWQTLRSCLTNELYVDYTEFRHEPGHIVHADDFVAKRTKAVKGLRMQHLSTNHLITITGDDAVCQSCFLIHRIGQTHQDEESFFDSAGHYRHGLQRIGDSWKINSIKQTIVWNRGNPEIHGGFRS